MFNLIKKFMNKIIDIVFDEINSNWLIEISDLVSKTKIKIEELLPILEVLNNEQKIMIDYNEENSMNGVVYSWDSYLDKFNYNLHKKTLLIKENVENQREEKWYINYELYNINKIKKDLYDLFLIDKYINDIDDIKLWFIDRSKFDWDLTLSFPNLLSEHKSSWYTTKIIPEIILKLMNSELYKTEVFTNITQKWIYINISLSDKFLYKSINQILQYWDKYWENDLYKWKSVVVDYSSPNTAKHLHAGHIRSTIIGHVLSNLYDANWYTVHRINHLNDWWWFGYLIEWYNRWKSLLPNFELENDLLFYIYTLYRKWEKASINEENFNKLDDDELSELKKYYWNFHDYMSYKKLFILFKESSAQKFNNLESWKKQEVDLWEQMVNWSMNDFNRFYNLLWINQDYFIWESFFSKIWKNLVLENEKKWNIVFYDEKESEEDIIQLKIELDDEKITEKQFDVIKSEILNDIWSYVVKLDNYERFVVLKKDESTIYATRDLAAIKYRNDVFNPSRIVYEVWEEQAEHFDKLFKSASKIWLSDSNFSHIYHWFYIDSNSKKKLSSRDWASNVLNLINNSIEYFKKKYIWNDLFSEDEINDISYKIALWSIIFNDLKKDKKSPVLINNDIEKTCELFEQSGWAYIMYSVARARSILTKYWSNIPDINDIDFSHLEDIEKIIINDLNKYPLIVDYANSTDNPAVLCEYLLSLSKNYNSYYNSYRVLDWNSDYRLKILEAFIQIVTNCVKILHIELPERI